jgi:hypothetical protein
LSERGDPVVAHDGWVPPEKLPRSAGWRRWLTAVVAGLLAFGAVIYVGDYYQFDVRGKPFDLNESGLLVFVGWIVASVVTALVGRAQSLVDWAVAYALTAAVLLGLMLIAVTVFATFIPLP